MRVAKFVLRRWGLTRYFWELVEVNCDPEKVLARGTRHYASKDDARAAIEAVMTLAPGAEVVDLTEVPGPAVLPTGSFRIEDDVLPLYTGQYS
jgi:uncharacterized protein YegP (UPF0339 family)